ncbi:MAG: glycerol-3-phosphate acyltransferase [Anaerolineae bacterium]
MGLNLLAWAALGYFVGAIPSAALVVRLLGSPGDNARHARRIAVVAFALDVVKGAALVWLASQLAWTAYATSAAGIMAVVGQSWSFWTPKRGGTGMPVAIGALAVTVPLALFVGAAAGALAFALFRRPVIAALIGAAITPLASALLHYPSAAVLLALGAALVVCLRTASRNRHASDP